MSPEQLSNLKSKFEGILELSEDQLSGLKTGDTNRFRQALAAKGMVIESIVGSIGSAANDPMVISLIAQIKDCEEQSVQLINSKLDSVRRDLATAEKSKIASKAYGKTTRKTPAFVPTEETPVMLDRRR